MKSRISQWLWNIESIKNVFKSTLFITAFYFESYLLRIWSITYIMVRLIHPLCQSQFRICYLCLSTTHPITSMHRESSVSMNVSKQLGLCFESERLWIRLPINSYFFRINCPCQGSNSDCQIPKRIAYQCANSPSHRVEVRCCKITSLWKFTMTALWIERSDLDPTIYYVI